MPGRAEQLFQDLQNSSAILKLIGQSEDVQFDCKEWPAKDEDAQKTFAKAACGLTNADGGVLVVGMRAKAISKDEPDVVDSAVPVADTAAVKSRILDLLGQLVEPGIQGVQAAEVADNLGAKSGFVVVYVPASEGYPRRSRKDWKFYLRIGSGTFPMEYFQIADMFGRRPHPDLKLYFEFDSFGKLPDGNFAELWWLGLTNVGRGIAKFPGVRFRREGHGFAVYQWGIDGNANSGLPSRPADSEWIVFRGGVDDVIYPHSTLKITKLRRSFNSVDQISDRWVFHPFKFQIEISCEGMRSTVVEQHVPERWRNKP